LRKFIGLITNEYIKVVCKVSTKIMLIAIVLVALGFNLLVYVASRQPAFHMSGWTLEDRINEAQHWQFDGWEEVVERYTYFIELDINIALPWNHPDGWRTNAAYYLFSLKSYLFTIDQYDEGNGYAEILRIHINALDQAIRNNDWLAFYRAELDYMESQAISRDNYHMWALRYRIEHEIVPGSWQNDVVSSIVTAKHEIARLSTFTADPETEAMIAAIEETVLIGEYRLENDIRSFTHAEMASGFMQINNVCFWDIFANSTGTIALLSVLIIVVAGSILSAEFSAGTVKFLLINPVKRWKIFTSKYVAIVTLTLAMLVILYIFNALFAGIFFGFGDITAPYLSVVNGRVVTGSSFGFVASRYLLGVIGTIVIGTFAFAVSSLVKSSALAIGLGVFLYFSGSMAVMVLNALNVYQAKYILFANTNILNVINGTTGFVNHTLLFAVINISVYMFVFLLTAWDGFVRGDIK